MREVVEEKVVEKVAEQWRSDHSKNKLFPLCRDCQMLLHKLD